MANGLVGGIMVCGDSRVVGGGVVIMRDGGPGTVLRISWDGYGTSGNGVGK